jgi:hypothetical protein
LGTFSIGVGGEYNGTETRLPDGIFPKVHFHASDDFNTYLASRIEVLFDGLVHDEGSIGSARDEATGLENNAVTAGGILTIHGLGLKIEFDEAHQDKAGLYFDSENGAGAAVKAQTLVVNEPKTLKVLVPADLETGKRYALRIVTQSSARDSHHLLKEPREMLSDFALTALT